MAYSLEKDGDLYETRYWNILKESFPNYEVFWAQFIVPLTGRTERQGIALKNGTHPLLENISMAHYTVFYHLGVAVDLQERLGQEFSEDALFHLSSATEMVDRLIFEIAKLRVLLSGGDFATKATDEDIAAIAQNYSSEEYSKAFERFLRRGQSVYLRLHNPADVTMSFMQTVSEQASKDFESWQKTANQIRHYRNTLAHNPKLGALSKTREKIYIPKESELYKYELWSSVTNRSDNNDFISLPELIGDFQTKLVEKTNRLWEHLIIFMDATVKIEGYNRLLGNGITILLDEETIPSDAIYALPSGTHPYDPTISSLD